MSLLASDLHLSTLREIPADADIPSHRLLLQSGMIRPTAAGIYTWMPLGLRVLQKVHDIVRKCMNETGALEVMMPVVQPADLWEQSGRWHDYGPDLARLIDRRGRNFCLGPTHEEVITAVARDTMHSYRDLPINYYQIQTKFRDEIRPRFGLLRCREFIMKDAYSFHLGDESLDVTYQAMRQAYCKILDTIGVDYRVVSADTGSIGGDSSHEFQILSEIGEDVIATNQDGSFAANRELVVPPAPSPAATATTAEALTQFPTPSVRTIADLKKFADVAPEAGVKTLFVKGSQKPLCALVIRGDHELNAVMAERNPEVAIPFEMAEPEVVTKMLGAGFGSLGPVGIAEDIPLLVDPDAEALHNFVCGANKDDVHYRGVNWGRDCPAHRRTVTLRLIEEGEMAPDGSGALHFYRGIEVGHIFKLGDKYSASMGLNVIAEDGSAATPLMGCYGFGVSRVVAAVIEQFHDDKGILWPATISPFDLVLVSLGDRDAETSQRLRDTASSLYQSLTEAGLEVLWDDRDLRPGVKFADAELIGVPHILTLGAKSLAKGEVEYRHRTNKHQASVPLEDTQGLISLLKSD